EEDKKNKESIEVKNELDGLVYATEKSIADHGDKISGEEKTALENALTSAKETLKNGLVEDMKKAKETLMQASHKLAESIYKDAAAKSKTGAAAGAGAASGAPTGNAKPGGEGAVDAEVVDEGKK